MSFIYGYDLLCVTRLKKGAKFSEEHRYNLSISHTGHKHTEETKAKMSAKRKGMVRNATWCKNISLVHQGMKHKPESIIKMRLAKLGRKLPLSTRIKMSEASKGKLKPPCSITTRMKRSRAQQYRKVVKSNTVPERKLQGILIHYGVQFETHKPILGRPDIFIEPNICIFVDGDYWHKLSQNIIYDKFVNFQLQSEGYIVLRFWENEIKTSLDKIVSKILKAAGIDLLFSNLLQPKLRFIR